MHRRTLLRHLATLPAAATLASCAKGAGGSTVAKSPRPVPAPGPVADAPKILDITGRHTTKTKGWPLKPLPAYSVKEAEDFDHMPAKATLVDFLKHRFLLAQHLLNTADWALSQKLPEHIVMAALLHDVGLSIARPDHGYWGSYLVRPYVSEETAWAIVNHQHCRFFADPGVGYKGPPEFYKKFFGENYKIDPYIEEAYKAARKHKWYMSARLVTMADQETPEPKDLYVDDVKRALIDPEKFTDVIGRNFKQPKEGLGFDNSPAAHMWRTLINPSRPL